MTKLPQSSATSNACRPRQNANGYLWQSSRLPEGVDANRCHEDNEPEPVLSLRDGQTVSGPLVFAGVNRQDEGKPNTVPRQLNGRPHHVSVPSTDPARLSPVSTAPFFRVEQRHWRFPSLAWFLAMLPSRHLPTPDQPLAPTSC